MEGYSLGAIEKRVAEMIWSGAPMPTAELVRQCESALGWKRTTTYTVLKKFIRRGIFENDGGMIRVLIPRNEFYARQTHAYIDQSFGGSLPGFLAAFTNGRKLSAKEIREIEKIIERGGAK